MQNSTAPATVTVAATVTALQAKLATRRAYVNLARAIVAGPSK